MNEITSNFGRLVLGCMDSYDSDQRLILQGFSRSTRFAFFCTAQSWFLALYRFPAVCCCGCRSTQPRNSALKVVRPSRGGDPLAWHATDRTWSFVCCYPVVVIWPPTLPPPSVVVGSLVSGILGGFFVVIFPLGFPNLCTAQTSKFQQKSVKLFAIMKNEIISCNFKNEFFGEVILFSRY